MLAFPESGQSDHLWDERPPQGTFMVIEVDLVEARYETAVEKGLPIQQQEATLFMGRYRVRQSTTRKQ